MEWGVCGKNPFPDFLSCWNEDILGRDSRGKWLLLSRGGIVQLVQCITVSPQITLTHLKQVTKNKRENAYFSVDSPFQLKEWSCLYKYLTSF